MNDHRRRLLASLGALGAGAGLLGSLSSSGLAASADYRALIVLFLIGGNDGHNLLVPTDGAYLDYQRARTNLALPKNSLIALPGTALGHRFGLHPAMAALAPLYERQRLAFVANAGPLVEPATSGQVLDQAVQLPPFLLSHADQVSMQQGWLGMDDDSGWAGRAMELLPGPLQHPLNAVTLSMSRRLVSGRRAPPSFLPTGETSHFWGPAMLLEPASDATQYLFGLSRLQSRDVHEAEYARTMSRALTESTRFTQVRQAARTPTADFGSGELAQQLRTLASMLPVFKSEGLRRQVFLLEWGVFDTHANQRGTASWTQDSQLAEMARALAGLDATLQSTGLADDVAVLGLSDFGRTLRASSGGGSEHAWGNHLFAFGEPVNGGTVHGQFPTLTLGGPDDGDPRGNGRLVPTTSTDQIAATMTKWLGLPDASLEAVYPWLANFGQQTLPALLRA